MAVFAAWAVKKGSEIKAPREAWIVLFLLSMMAEMAISIVIYLYFPTAVFEIILLNMWVMMVIGFAFAVLYVFGEPKTLDETLSGIVRVRSLIIALIVALVLLSEVFMAWTFALIGGTASTAGGLQGIFTTITNSSSSFWFIFMNSAEMAITLFFIRDRLPKAFSWLIASQVIIMVLSPTAIINSVWAGVSLAAGSAIMTFLFIYIFKFLHKNQTLSKGILNYLLFLMLAYALMMAGQFIWLLNGDAAVFVLIHNSRDGGVLRNSIRRKEAYFFQIGKLAVNAVLGLWLPLSHIRGRVLYERGHGHPGVRPRLFQWNHICVNNVATYANIERRLLRWNDGCLHGMAHQKRLGNQDLNRRWHRALPPLNDSYDVHQHSRLPLPPSISYTR